MTNSAARQPRASGLRGNGDFSQSGRAKGVREAIGISEQYARTLVRHGVLLRYESMLVAWAPVWRQWLGASAAGSVGEQGRCYLQVLAAGRSEPPRVVCHHSSNQQPPPPQRTSTWHPLPQLCNGEFRSSPFPRF